MGKKMYYRVDNGDQPVVGTLKDINDMIEAESSGYNEDSNKSDEPSWNITLVFLTDDEFEDLPDAY